MPRQIEEQVNKLEVLEKNYNDGAIITAPTYEEALQQYQNNKYNNLLHESLQSRLKFTSSNKSLITNIVDVFRYYISNIAVTATANKFSYAFCIVDPTECVDIVQALEIKYKTLLTNYQQKLETLPHVKISDLTLALAGTNSLADVNLQLDLDHFPSTLQSQEKSLLLSDKSEEFNAGVLETAKNKLLSYLSVDKQIEAMKIMENTNNKAYIDIFNKFIYDLNRESLLLFLEHSQQYLPQDISFQTLILDEQRNDIDKHNIAPIVINGATVNTMMYIVQTYNKIFDELLKVFKLNAQEYSIIYQQDQTDINENIDDTHTQDINNTKLIDEQNSEQELELKQNRDLDKTITDSTEQIINDQNQESTTNTQEQIDKSLVLSRVNSALDLNTTQSDIDIKQSIKPNNMSYLKISALGFGVALVLAITILIAMQLKESNGKKRASTAQKLVKNI